MRTCLNCGHAAKHTDLVGCLETDTDTGYCDCTTFVPVDPSAEDQRTLPEPLDAAEGERLKAEGQNRVLNETNALTMDLWRSKAYEVLEDWGKTRDAFTSTDLVAEIGMPPRSNAVGAVMTGAAKRGLIRGTGQYVKSTRPGCHAAVVQVWTIA